MRWLDRIETMLSEIALTFTCYQKFVDIILAGDTNININESAKP